MADQILEQGQGLQVTDRTLYVDIGGGVLARVDGAVAMVGSALASASNPIPVVLTNPSTGQTLPIDTLTGALEIISTGEVAALNGDVVCRWVNDKVPGAVQTVLTDGPAGNQPGIYYNLNLGEIVMVTQMCMELTTANDDVAYELGFTDAINGGGTFTPITPKRAYSTGAGPTGFTGVMFDITPPGPVSYANGARSITFRVDCNDAGATISPAWHSYVVG